ncbi:MAG: HDOD domain-containing protein [Terriglobales bacterium]
MTTPAQTDRIATQLKLIDLPPFPAVAIRALQLVSQSETRLSELHDLISADPAFAVEILRLANSPLYGIRVEITSTVQATILLGFERVKGLALTIAMRAYIEDFLHIPALRASWRHSLACAAVAEDLAAASLMDKDSAYTGALLHDIGRLALAVMQPDLYSQLFQTATGTPEYLLQRERELFGVEHCDAGRMLTTAWKLPQIFVDITSHHHDRPKEQPLDLTGLIALSCRVADSLGFEFVANPERESYQMLVSGLPDTARARIPADPNEVAARITDKISCLESMGPSTRNADKGDQRKPATVASLGHATQTGSAPAHGRSH